MSKAALVVATGIIAIVCASCAEEVGNAAQSASMNRQLCTEADLGGGYAAKASGTFSVQNLADLASNPSARETQLKTAGLEGGQFAFWEQNVSPPPFPPPLEVVCQAMLFHSPEEAAAFVQTLEPKPDALASLAIAWLPNEHRTVAAVGPSDIGELPGARAFLMTAHDSQLHYRVYVVVVPAGRYVRTVYLGNNGTRASLTGALNIAHATTRRVSQ